MNPYTVGDTISFKFFKKENTVSERNVFLDVKNAYLKIEAKENNELTFQNFLFIVDNKGYVVRTSQLKPNIKYLHDLYDLSNANENTIFHERFDHYAINEIYYLNRINAIPKLLSSEEPLNRYYIEEVSFRSKNEAHLNIKYIERKKDNNSASQTIYDYEFENYKLINFSLDNMFRSSSFYKSESTTTINISYDPFEPDYLNYKNS